MPELTRAEERLQDLQVFATELYSPHPTVLAFSLLEISGRELGFVVHYWVTAVQHTAGRLSSAQDEVLGFGSSTNPEPPFRGGMPALTLFEARNAPCKAAAGRRGDSADTYSCQNFN